jgi:hypothetical protein
MIFIGRTDIESHSAQLVVLVDCVCFRVVKFDGNVVTVAIRWSPEFQLVGVREA